MWLINTTSFDLTEFGTTWNLNIPRYAILSHVWEEGEVSFADHREQRQKAEAMIGWSKITSACKEARSRGLNWIWIDTCCIDQRYDAKQSEAIRSMFKYYSEAVVCITYLYDVAPRASSSLPTPVSHSGSHRNSPLINHHHDLSKSKWFCRGWTLQELIAPRSMIFVAKDWSFLAEKSSNSKPLNDRLHSITGIPIRVLQQGNRAFRTPVAQRMSWMARRKTTREEDMAYALMGLFQVTMDVQYGETEQNAFLRLQLKILEGNVDYSLFAWKHKVEEKPGSPPGCLALSPRWFENSSKVHVTISNYDYAHPPMLEGNGLRTFLQVRRTTDSSERLATLPCYELDERTGEKRGILIFLAPWFHKLSTSENRFGRRRANEFSLASYEPILPAEREGVLMKYKDQNADTFDQRKWKSLGSSPHVYIDSSDPYNDD